MMKVMFSFLTKIPELVSDGVGNLIWGLWAAKTAAHLWWACLLHPSPLTGAPSCRGQIQVSCDKPSGLCHTFPLPHTIPLYLQPRDARQGRDQGAFNHWATGASVEMLCGLWPSDSSERYWNRTEPSTQRENSHSSLNHSLLSQNHLLNWLSAAKSLSQNLAKQQT